MTSPPGAQTRLDWGRTGGNWGKSELEFVVEMQAWQPGHGPVTPVWQRHTATHAFAGVETVGLLFGHALSAEVVQTRPGELTFLQDRKTPAHVCFTAALACMTL